MTDQQRFDTIHALGNTVIRTPNLDRLAARGAAFTNAYSTCPVCVPARYTIRSGSEPTRTGFYRNRPHHARPVADIHSAIEDRCGPYLGQTMRNIGYSTFGVGKFHTQHEWQIVATDRCQQLVFERCPSIGRGWTRLRRFDSHGSVRPQPAVASSYRYFWSWIARQVAHQTRSDPVRSMPGSAASVYCARALPRPDQDQCNVAKLRRKRVGMKSKTKRTLTSDEIDAVVAKTFGCRPERVEEFHGGSMNAVYRIDLPGRELTVLKVGSSRTAPLLTYEADALRTEASFYETAGDLFPLPKLIAKDLSREIIDSDYIFIDMLKGRPWAEVADRVSELDDTRLKRELGRLVGKLHTIQGTRFGYTQPGTPSGATWPEAFLAMLDAVLEDTITWNVTLPISQDAIRSGIGAASWALHDVKSPCLLHFDLWKSNVFLTNGQDGEWSLEGIIDCERAYYGDPLAELVGINPMQDPHDVAFIAGYAETASTPFELTPSAEARLTMYMVYLALIWVTEAVPHGYLEGPEPEVLRGRQFYAGLGQRIATLVETCWKST